MLRFTTIVLILLSSSTYWGQLSATYNDPDENFKKAIAFYKEGNFVLAKLEFQKIESIPNPNFEDQSSLLRLQAKLYAAMSHIKGDLVGAEKVINDFYTKTRPDPLASRAIFEIGNYYFEEKKHREALVFYDKVDKVVLSEVDHLSYHFKKGYSQFLLKDFTNARASFEPILGKDSEYYFNAYYYMAMIEFFEDNYDTAIEYFFIVENFPEYKTRIPYYIGQIYFSKQKYAEIVDYIPKQLKIKGVHNVKELRYILGQTYFLLNDYSSALPHLEYHEAQSRTMSKEDFYQLAFTQYQMGKLEKASLNFRELSNLQSYLGQISNNYLGDIYLKLNQKEEARFSFKKVMDYELNAELEQEATFNYGKLSAELGYDRAAIASLISLKPSSPDYAQAQNVLGSLFESSKDYEMVIKTIESMENRAPKILEAYQKVILERGIQLMNDGDRTLAKTTLLKAIQSPASNYYSAIIYYTIGDLLHQEGKFTESITYLNKYFTLLSLVDKLPDSAGPTLANYLQGYNYLKIKDYNTALRFFEKAKSSIDFLVKGNPIDFRKQRLYADIVSRIGDCYFTQNKYEKASEHYAEASKIKFPGQDYAFFQRSMIRGLQGKTYEKIVLLEELISKIPTSSFLDDAYFQIGEAQLALGNSREAELAFQNIINLREKSNLTSRALLKLGLIVYNQGDSEAAIEYYERVFKSNPNKNEAQEALLSLKEIYVEDLGRADDFVAIVEEATGYKMSTFERDSLSYVAAQGRFDQGEYIEAIKAYTRYIEQYPNGINLLTAIYNLAESHAILEDYEKALAGYDRIIEYGQSDYYEDAILKAALIAYNDLQRFEKAFNYYNLLNEVTSDQILQYDAQLGGLRSAFRYGNKDAVLFMSKLLLNNELAKKEDKAIAYFFSGKMHLAEEAWDAAIANLSQVQKLVDNENAAEAKFLVNEIYFEKGDIKTAEDLTLETVSNSTAYPYWVAKNLILYADIMLDRVDLFNARAALEAVLENFPESEELSRLATERLEQVSLREAEMTRLENDTTRIKLDTIQENE